MNAKEWLLSRVFEIYDDVYPEDMGAVELSDALEYGERVKAERETCQVSEKAHNLNGRKWHTLHCSHCDESLTDARWAFCPECGRRVEQ